MRKDRQTVDQEPHWVHEALAGSTQAFGKLVERHERSVYAFLLSRTHDRELAQELAQETFVRAYEGLDRFDEGQRFLKWVLGIAHHVGAEWQRREQRRQRVTQDATLELRRPQGSKGTGRLQAEVSVMDRILEAIADCPESYRVPLTLRYLDQLSYEEISETLKLSESQIKGILYRGKKLLKQKLAGLWEEMG